MSPALLERSSGVHGPEPVASWWCDARANYIGGGGADDWRRPRGLPPAGPLFLEDDYEQIRRNVVCPSLEGIDWSRYLERQRGDAQVWRLPTSQAAQLAIREATQAGLRVLVEAEEPILDWTFPLFVGKTLTTGLGIPNRRLEREMAGKLRATHRAICRMANGVIVPTATYAGWYGSLNQNVHVIPYAVDPDDWPPLNKPTDGVFRVGFAGGRGRIDDLEIVRPALEWAATQPNVEIVFIGGAPWLCDTITERRKHAPVLEDMFANADKLLELRQEMRQRQARWERIPTRLIRWTADAAEYRRALQLFDVAICPQDPTLEGPWRTAGGDKKCLEAVMACALPLCSDAAPYKEWVNRYTPSPATSDEWLALIKWCVANRDEVHERAGAARDYVLTERTIDRTIPLWREACQPAQRRLNTREVEAGALALQH